MALREFYEFASWPSWGQVEDRRDVVQSMVHEVGALVAVRRSVADVDWIQQAQSCVGAALDLARSTAQADDGGVDENT